MTMARATYEFLTSEYEMNHGAAPRGRGSWAFSFVRRYRDVQTEEGP